MQRDPVLASLLAEFVMQKFRAVTIAKRVPIGSYVADACIIEATPEAAVWYGWSDVKRLLGQWQSLLQHPRDAQLGRVLSLRHHLGYTVPTRYVSRIRQGDSDIFRPVLKETTRLMLEGESYWITVLQEPTEAPLAEQIDVDRHFPLPETEETTRYTGPLSVADLEQLFHRLGLSADMPFFTLELVRSHISDDSVSQKSNDANTNYCPDEKQALFLALRPGQTYRMPTGRYIHWCAVCLNLWRSNEEWPPQCGHRTCHSPYWRTGKMQA